MNGHEHGRAIDLISRREIEGVTEAEARWLESHLAECADCSEYELAMGSAEQAMRSFTVMATGSLVESTQARVHARAVELRERESRQISDRDFLRHGRRVLDAVGVGVVEAWRVDGGAVQPAFGDRRAWGGVFLAVAGRPARGAADGVPRVEF